MYSLVLQSKRKKLKDILREIIFATHNKHKANEVKDILGQSIEILSLSDLNFMDQIPENEPTLEGNASFKSQYIYNIFKKDCFADDTGLEIEALSGKPGVHSARYAGPNGTYKDIVAKVLNEMHGVENRKAQFRTVISLFLDGKEYFFEGIVRGNLTYEPKGTEGFGYDPIFIPEGYNKTFAQMSLSEKNQISHRARALQRAKDLLSRRMISD